MLCRSVLVSLLFIDIINGGLLEGYSNFSCECKVDSSSTMMVWLLLTRKRLRSDLELEVGSHLETQGLGALFFRISTTFKVMPHT